eukprot:s180_g8.t1
MKDLDRIDQSFQNAYGELAKVMAELVACRCLDKVNGARDTIKKPQLASCAFEVVVGLLYKMLVLMEMKKGLKRGADVPQEETKKRNPRKKQ